MSQISFWACQQCKVVCHQITGPTGEQVWAHGRAWETHDHDVIPIRMPAGAAALSCDYCGALGARWIHDGSNVAAYFPDAGKSLPYGPRWSACDVCDRLAMRGDVESLTTQHFIAAKDTYGDESTDFLRDMYRAVIRRYLPSIRRRQQVPPPPPPPAPLTPQRLPKVRDKLVDSFAEGGLQRKVIAAEHPTDEPIYLPAADYFNIDSAETVSVTHPSPKVVERFCDRMMIGLRTADLYWVSSEFTLLAVNAGKKLPDLSVTPTELPSASGLIVYAQPIFEYSIVNDKSVKTTVEIVALSWVRIPGGIWVTIHLRTDGFLPDVDPQWLHTNYGFLIPAAPGAGLEFGEKVDVEALAKAKGGQAWGTLLSTWFLMAQPGVGTVTTQQPDRKTRQKAARAGRSAPTVHVVDLRRQKAATAGGSDTGRSFHYSVRFLVGGETGGFWRDQAYGPKRGLRKRLWIEPFLKGPAGAPLKTGDKPPTVKVLR